MHERIVIIGAGIAGLGVALALQRTDREICLLERDAPPPTTCPADIFTFWERPGVPQLRHSHGFLARLRNLLRERYPELYQRLLQAGVRELRFGDSLPPSLAPHYQPRPEDDELTALLCRRTTFEAVLRSYVQEQPGIHLHSSCQADGLLTTRDRPLRITGVSARQHAESVPFPADMVIDASGRRSPCLAWLRQLGATMTEENTPTGILYYTQFYRLCDGCEEPQRTSFSSIGDLGYLKFGVWPADHRTFSVTLAIPTLEPELRMVRQQEVFTRVCQALPALAPWVDPGRAEPISAIFAMGDLHNTYRRFYQHGQPAAAGYFAVGEAALHTNPLYGRGCTLSLLHAHLFADICNTTATLEERARRFHERTEAELYPFFRLAVQQDQAGIERVRRLHMPQLPLSWRQRLRQAFTSQGVMPAMRGDFAVRRAALREFHMLTPPGKAFRQPAVMLRILRFWLRGRRKNALLTPPRSGPDRLALRQLLGLEAL